MLSTRLWLQLEEEKERVGEQGQADAEVKNVGGEDLD